MKEGEIREIERKASDGGKVATSTYPTVGGITEISQPLTWVKLEIIPKYILAIYLLQNPLTIILCTVTVRTNKRGKYFGQISCSEKHSLCPASL